MTPRQARYLVTLAGVTVLLALTFGVFVGATLRAVCGQ